MMQHPHSQMIHQSHAQMQPMMGMVPHYVQLAAHAYPSVVGHPEELSNELFSVVGVKSDPPQLVVHSGLGHGVSESM